MAMGPTGGLRTRPKGNIDQLKRKNAQESPKHASSQVDKRNGIAILTQKMQMTPIVLYTLAIAEGAIRVYPIRPWTP
jgi:hypothetical protein